MDPITQTLLGAVAAQTFFGKKLGRWAGVIGGLVGEAPDLDIFFTRFADPATDFQYHRHFTHSLFFIPIGAALAALPFMLIPSLRKRWQLVYGAALVGFATHAPLDACTSWGTMLLWPATDLRYGWDIISIIDPIFTLILIVGVAASFIWKSHRIALIALLLSIGYLGLGALQHARGMSAQREIAAQRGHRVEHGRVMPTFANLFIWRSVYKSEGELHADGLRLLPFTAAQVMPGESIEAVELDALAQQPDASPRLRAALRRFDIFADGFTAIIPGSGMAVGDMRYSLDQGGFTPMWGIAIISDNGELVPMRWRRRSQQPAGAAIDLAEDVVEAAAHHEPGEDAGAAEQDGRRRRLEQIWRMINGDGDWELIRPD